MPAHHTRAVTVLTAPDKFKGSLTAPQVAGHLAGGLRRAVPGIDVVSCPVADGGDGTVDAVVANGFTAVPVTVTDSLGRPRSAAFARRHDLAVVELAEADGLRHLAADELAPLTATSFGVGELVRAALDHGCRTVILGLGGSANTDGGAGLLQALGARLLDVTGAELPPGGAALARLARIDTDDLDPRLADTTVVVASDVDNPLLGEHGAAAVYAPQKGATEADVRALETGLQRWAQRTAAATRRDVSGRPGAGAAGGVGFAAIAFLGATVRPGIELVLDLIDFENRLSGADLVITGEGSLDRQSLHGKAPIGVAKAAGRRGIPTVAVAGRSTLPAVDAEAAGLTAIYALTDLEPDVAVCISDAGRLLEQLAATIAADRFADPTVQPDRARIRA